MKEALLPMTVRRAECQIRRELWYAATTIASGEREARTRAMAFCEWVLGRPAIR